MNLYIILYSIASRTLKIIFLYFTFAAAAAALGDLVLLLARIRSFLSLSQHRDSVRSWDRKSENSTATETQTFISLYLKKKVSILFFIHLLKSMNFFFIFFATAAAKNQLTVFTFSRL